MLLTGGVAGGLVKADNVICQVDIVAKHLPGGCYALADHVVGVGTPNSVVTTTTTAVVATHQLSIGHTQAYRNQFSFIASETISPHMCKYES